MNWHRIQGQCRRAIGEVKGRWLRAQPGQTAGQAAQGPGPLQTQQGLFPEEAEIIWLRTEGAKPEAPNPASAGAHPSAERTPDPPAPVATDVLDATASHTATSSSVDGAPATKPEAFLHLPSGAVRFWIAVDQRYVGASIHSVDLHYRYCSHETTDQPLATFLAHAGEIEAAVRRRLDAGALEPVILRGPDLQPVPSP